MGIIMNGRKRLSARLLILWFFLWYLMGTATAAEVDGGRAVM
jgi:hypothetical protein